MKKVRKAKNFGKKNFESVVSGVELGAIMYHGSIWRRISISYLNISHVPQYIFLASAALTTPKAEGDEKLKIREIVRRYHQNEPLNFLTEIRKLSLEDAI